MSSPPKELNTFVTTVSLRDEFNKAYLYFNFKTFTEALRYLMAETIREYHKESGIKEEDLSPDQRIEFYGRIHGSRIRANDLRAAANR